MCSFFFGFFQGATANRRHPKLVRAIFVYMVRQMMLIYFCAITIPSTQLKTLQLVMSSRARGHFIRAVFSFLVEK